MEQAGIYKVSFDPVIETLAEILERRDEAIQGYKDSGLGMVVVFNNGSSATNPWIKTWNDLNTQALKYWHDLGLTPAGLKKLDESAMKQKKVSSLGEVLRSLEA